MKPLWPHQTRYVQRCREAYRAGFRSMCLVLPTGAGKTILAVALAHGQLARGGKVLWLVHRIELAEQARDALRDAGIPAGIISPNHPRTHEAVQIASIETLIARNLVLPGITMLVIDECHHIMADTYIDVRRQYPGILVIGLTATPGRADGRGLKDAFDCMIAEVQPRELIALHEQNPAVGLVPVKVIGPAIAVNNAAAYPVDLYLARAKGRKAIAFTSTVKQAEDLAEAFRLAGIPARCVDGNMDATERADTLSDFRAGNLQVLTNVMVLTEGFDCREVSCVILASKVGSPVAYVQKTGRGMRCAPGKKDCLVLDLFGSSHELQMLPDSDREYSLEGTSVRAVKRELIEIIQCKSCGEWFSAGVFAGGKCPGCGWIKPSKPDPRVVHQEMIELQFERLSRPTDAVKVDWIKDQLARQRGGVGGILTAFYRKFHHYPNTAMREKSGFSQCQRAARERKSA